MRPFFKHQTTRYVLMALALMPLGLMGEYSTDLNFQQDQYLNYMAQTAVGRQKKKAKAQQNAKPQNSKPQQNTRHTPSAKTKNDQKLMAAKLNGTWKPHFVPLNYIEAKRSAFFQYNIGVGFLYFSDIQSNLGGAPALAFQMPTGPLPNFTNVPFKGRLQYSRSPLFEAIMGYRIWPWFQFALSYQHQGGMTVNTKAMNSSTATDGQASFQSQLNLDALMAKVYFNLPWALVMKNLAASPYLALGIGPGWQSWTRVQVQYFDTVGTFRNRYLALNDKICASAVWMADIGFKFQDAVRKQQFSLVVGCKYNQWGQARNIGAFKNQGSYPLGLAHPFKIKTVYSFAPYLGAQWEFSTASNYKTPILVNNRNANSWVPFWVKSNQFKDNGFWTQFNVGPGFLYFANMKGTIVAGGATPVPTLGPPTQYGTVEGGLSYNRTPLVEYLLGWRILPYLRAGIGFQYQSQVTVQSDWQNGTASTLGAPEPHIYRLSSSLNLNSVMLRAYFDLPWSMVFKSINFAPFIGAGIGPGWQTWSNITVQDVLINTGTGRNNNPIFLNNKISANATWLIDAGFKLKSLLPKVNFAFITGFKFNYWGQARNIGKLSQQGGSKRYLIHPLRIKNVYSFIPYFGVNWNFPNTYASKLPYAIDGKKINGWSPFITKSANIQNKQSVWTQFNAGVGFLYFSGVNARLSGIPGNSFNFEAAKKTMQGRLMYNRTPLFEYLIGYRFNDWVKAAFSFMRQSGICVQSQPQTANVPNANTNPLSKITFRSTLALNAILAKGYLELPYALIFKGSATSPYLGLAVGLGWQTWSTAVQHIRFDTGSINYISQQPLQRKISANAVWGLDLGTRIRSAYPNSKFSVTLGCKYTQWGQARNIGLITQQSSLKKGISRAFTIKTVYQFAPYVGIEWDF